MLSKDDGTPAMRAVSDPIKVSSGEPTRAVAGEDRCVALSFDRVCALGAEKHFAPTRGFSRVVSVVCRVWFQIRASSDVGQYFDLVLAASGGKDGERALTARENRFEPASGSAQV